LLAHLGEVDERQLYRAAAYESMFMYCVHELHMSEDTAVRRIGVARTAREFPAIFPALADGRLNLTAVLLLTPHLSLETAEALLAAGHRGSRDVRATALRPGVARPRGALGRCRAGAQAGAQLVGEGARAEEVRQVGSIPPVTGFRQRSVCPCRSPAPGLGA